MNVFHSHNFKIYLDHLINAISFHQWHDLIFWCAKIDAPFFKPLFPHNLSGCSNEWLMLGTSAIHKTLRAKNISSNLLTKTDILLMWHVTNFAKQYTNRGRQLSQVFFFLCSFNAIINCQKEIKRTLKIAHNKDRPFSHLPCFLTSVYFYQNHWYTVGVLWTELIYPW